MGDRVEATSFIGPAASVSGMNSPKRNLEHGARMRLRSYEPEDVERLAEIYRLAIHTLAASSYTQEELNAWAPPTVDLDRLRQRFASVTTIVAEHEGMIVGYLSHTPEGYIDLLFTHPSFAGRGIATLLYERAEKELFAAGVKRVFTHASLVARPFFLQRGFQEDRAEHVECRGVKLRRYAMHKVLPSAL